MLYEIEEQLSWVYGAALRAAGTEQDAEEAARAAYAGASPGESRTEMMSRAVRHALERSPERSLAMLAPPEREVIGLARILGLKVDEIAELVGCDAAEVKRRMRGGMQRLAEVVAWPAAT